MQILMKNLLLCILLLPAVASAEDGLSGSNTAWILTSTALVLFMTLPGLALFYGGLVRTKNVLSVLMQCFAIGGIVTILWLVVGYSLAFGEGNAYIREVAEHASVPVISMQCDVYHPCQTLADYLTITEKFGSTRGLKLGVASVGGSKYALKLAVESKVRFAGVLCGRATWKDGIPVYGREGAGAFRKWLEGDGVRNITNVNDSLAGASPWFSFYGAKSADELRLNSV